MKTPIVALAAIALVVSATASLAQTRGECTRKCGGVPGGCAANTKAAQACFNKCMGTNECPVGTTKGKKN